MSEQQGTAMVIVLLTVALILTAAAALLAAQRQDSQIVHAAYYAEQAYLAADAGLVRAVQICMQGQQQCAGLVPTDTNITACTGAPRVCTEEIAPGVRFQLNVDSSTSTAVVIRSAAQVDLPANMGGTSVARRALTMQANFDRDGTYLNRTDRG